jgi:hypothetical protein
MSQRYNCSVAGLIFFGVPPLFKPVEGEAQSRGEREIRDELSFQASDKPGRKKQAQNRLKA